MRNLTHALKTALDRFVAYSPKSNAGFGVLRPPMLSSRAYPTAAASVPLGLDKAGQPVMLPRGESVLIAGDPRTSVTTLLRVLTLGHARHPATRLHVYDSELFGEFDPLRGMAHRYIDTAHGAHTIGRTTADLAALADEIARRRRLLKDLNAELSAADAAIRRATGNGAPHATTLPELDQVPLAVWEAAGIDPGRIDTEIADLHQHVAVIGNAIRWALSDDDGPDFVDALAKIALGGSGLRVTVLVATPSAYLAYLPQHLIAAFRIRVATRMQNPEHADQILGALARQSGIAPGRLNGYGLCWVANLGAHREPTYQRAQVHDANPRFFRSECTRLTRVRARTGWLTGDATDRSKR